MDRIGEVLTTLTEQEMEVLIRRYAHIQHKRLMDHPDASRYYCSVTFHYSDEDSAKWSVRGVDSNSNVVMKGAVLGKTVAQVIAMHDMQKGNQILELEYSPPTSTIDDDSEITF